MKLLCERCGAKTNVYYVRYCPSCDIGTIIKGRHGSYAIIPMLDIAHDKFEFAKDGYWASFIKTLDVRNDRFIEILIDDAPQYLTSFQRDTLQLFDMFDVDIRSKHTLVWVSW